MTGVAIEWDDVGPGLAKSARGNGSQQRIVAELAERPGQWATFGPFDTMDAARSAVRQMHRLGCEIATRRTDDGWRSWARWPAVSHRGAMLDDVDSRPLRAVQ